MEFSARGAGTAWPRAAQNKKPTDNREPLSEDYTMICQLTVVQGSRTLVCVHQPSPQPTLYFLHFAFLKISSGVQNWLKVTLLSPRESGLRSFYCRLREPS